MRGSIRRIRRGTLALLALLAFMAVFATAAMAQSVEVTQADCDAGNIVDEDGNALSQSECEDLIGQRVDLAETGFEAWMFAAGGVLLIGAAATIVVIRRRPSSGTVA